MENSNIEENSLIINSDNEEITTNNIRIVDEQSNNMIAKKSTKLKDIPFIIYPLILSGFFLIISIIALLIIFSKYEKNYIKEENAYIKPKYSSHNYTSLIFNNGLKLVLVQVNKDDNEGGSISFDYGYLDNKYEPGHLKLAFLSLISDKLTNAEPGDNYLGKLNCDVGKYYSNFYFKILGGGFINYLKYFSELTYLNETKYEERFAHIKDKNITLDNTLVEKKNHILEYLVYGYKTSQGKDIATQGDKETIKNLNGDYSKIENIMKIILSETSKIKIVLYSHYKMSLMRKYFLRFFRDIINRPQNSNNEIPINAYNISEFTTNQIIYFKLFNNETNYIEINYFLSNNITYEQLIKDSQYLNYIIYILNQTDENSLYYELNNNENNNIGIKSLACNFEIILKSKIKFSILIEPNPYTYNYIHEIISKVYNYINNIILYINSYNNIVNDIRIEELDKISEQNFTFTEDSHEINFYKNLANDLFTKDEKNYLLKKMQFSKKDFIENITLVKHYFNQLTINNSIILFGFNTKTISKYNLRKSSVSYIFKKTNTTSLFGLTYSTTKLEDIIKPTYDNNYTKLLNPKKNEYISQFDSNSELVYNKEDYDNYFKIRYKEINESSNNYMKVYWKNDTSFHIPKILTTIYFFHPFSRPNLHDDDNQKIKANDRLYFEYILYFAYIFRSMTEQLADVFRAGNSFHIEFKENFFVFDLFFYSDIAEKAMDLFNNIICDKDKFMIELNKKFEIYKDIAFEDFDLGKNLDLNKRRFIFYQEITKDKDKILPPIYNHYNFPYEDFSNIQYNNLRKDEISSDIDSIKYIFLFGYCNKTKASNIYKIFMNNNFDLKTSFDLAGYTNTIINASNFVNWTLDKSEIDESHNVTFYTKDNRAQVNRFIIFTNYSLKYYCLSNMLIQLLEDDNNYKKDIRNLRNYEQKYIFISFFFKNNPIDNALFMNNAIESLNNNEKMRKPVDLIGDRFYYFLNSHKKITAVNHNNMFDSAWWITYDTLYHRKIEDNEDLDFPMETYQKFIDEIKEYINNQTKYIDVINEKKKL